MDNNFCRTKGNLGGLLWATTSILLLTFTNAQIIDKAVGSDNKIFTKWSEATFKDFSQKYRASQDGSKCTNDIQRVFTDLLKEPYAQKMYDAAGKIPSGVSEGNRFLFGSYGECSSVISPDRSIQGKYCMSSLSIYSTEFYYGSCVPNSCNATQALPMIKFLISQLKLPVNISVESTNCREERHLSSGAIAAIVIICVLAGLAVLGSVVEVLVNFTQSRVLTFTSHSKDMLVDVEETDEINERTGLLSIHNTAVSRPHNLYSNLDNPKQKQIQPKQSIAIKILLSFSLINNTKKLLNTETSSGPLACLNGMRVLSMWWVILGHSYLFPINVSDNVLIASEISKRFTFQPIINGTFSVDSFFFLSGLLVTYLCLKNLQEQGGKLKWGLFYFHRFWRLTPVYAYVILIYGWLFIFLGNGPIEILLQNSESTMKSINVCHTKWWANLLYINNFYPKLGDLGEQCVGWGWYLANDMQFFLVSPFIIMLLFRKRILGILICVFFILGCIIARLVTAIHFGILIPTNRNTKNSGDPLAEHGPLYNKPYTRMAPYIVGMLLGYALFKSACRPRLPRFISLVNWMAAVALGMSVAYGEYYYYHHNSEEASLGISVFYITCSRFTWGVALALVVYECATGRGGYINDMLSWKVWGPLGRLTYCAYLLHPMVLYVYLMNLETAFHITDFSMIYYYIGNIVITYMASFVLSILLEAPLLGLEKVLLKK